MRLRAVAIICFAIVALLVAQREIESDDEFGRRVLRQFAKSTDHNSCEMGAAICTWRFAHEFAVLRRSGFSDPCPCSLVIGELGRPESWGFERMTARSKRHVSLKMRTSVGLLYVGFEKSSTLDGKWLLDEVYRVP